MAYLVIFNPLPNRTRKNRLDQLIRHMKMKQLEFELFPTDGNDSANRHFLSRHQHRFETVIIVGGDGTFHHVLNSLDKQSSQTIGLLPAGTGNDFARWIYGPHRNNVNWILNVLTGDNTEQIKLGEAHFPNQPAANQVRLFHNVLGVGFDAKLAKELANSKGLFRSLSYLSKALQHIPFYKEPWLSANIDGQSHQYFNLITAIANHQYFGNGLNIAPGASPTESKLMLCRIEKMSLIAKLRHILGVIGGHHVHLPMVDFRPLEEGLSVLTEGLDVEADGEYLGQSPVHIKVHDKPWRIKRQAW